MHNYKTNSTGMSVVNKSKTLPASNVLDNIFLTAKSLYTETDKKPLSWELHPRRRALFTQTYIFFVSAYFLNFLRREVEIEFTRYVKLHPFPLSELVELETFTVQMFFPIRNDLSPKSSQFPQHYERPLQTRVSLFSDFSRRAKLEEKKL